MKLMVVLAMLTFTNVLTSVELLPIEQLRATNNDLIKSIQRGQEVYTGYCIQCHLGHGKGSEKVPPVAGSDWLVNKRKESIHAIKYGQSGPIKVNGKKYNGTMSPMGLSDEEVADVMNYISNSWGNKQTKMVTVDEVAGIKK
jgi:mono/diheme cytochrome c family protein